jgi:PAS domain S-box-containing protein
MKFATKLLLALAGTIVTGTLVLIASAEIQATRLLEGQLTQRLEDNAHHLLDKLDRYLDERSLEVRTLTSAPAFIAATASSEAAARFLRDFLRWHREYSSATFATMERVRVADAAALGVGERDESEGCWAEIAAGKEVAACMQRSAPRDLLSLNLAVVVREGRVARGVVILRLPLQVLEDQLRPTAGSPSGISGLHVDLVDRTGVLLYSSADRENVLRTVSPDWAFVEPNLRAGQGPGSLRYANPAEAIGEKILVSVPERGVGGYPGSGWTLLLYVPTQEVFAPVQKLRLGIAAAFLLFGAGLLAIIVFLVRSFTRPLEAMSHAAAEIGKGNLEVRSPVGARDELGLFAETFNQMAGALQESQREVLASRRELESLVEVRTGELIRTNELLHAELSERAKAQEALAARERLLRLNADVGGALTLGHELATTLQMCAEFIVGNLDAFFVRVWTLEAGTEVLELKASAGRYTRVDGRHSRKIVGKQKIGLIAQNQRPILTNTVVGDPAITDQEWARQEGVVAFAGHPLVIDGKTVGVMALFSRRRLEPFVLSTLEAVADKIAAFIGRKQAEELLRVSERRFRNLFEATIDGVYEVDAQGVFTNVNPAGALMFGHKTPAEIVGRRAVDYWRDPRDRDAFLSALKAKKSVIAYPMPARRHNGDPLELEASVRIVEDESGAFLGHQGVLRDVSERVRGEAERELLLAQLQEAAANIRTLSGLLPICAACKKIRDGQGRWSQIETYISSHSEASFSHGLCPECQKVYFPGVTVRPKAPG